MKKNKPLIRTDLSVEERLERLERAVFNIDTCDKCKQDFDASDISIDHKYTPIRLCILCFVKLEDDKNGKG